MMVSRDYDTMSKMTENNPLLAMMQDGEVVKKSTEAWMKAMPKNTLAAQSMAVMATTSAIGFGVYSQMAGAMLGAMKGAAQTADKMKSGEMPTAPINPFAFEWGAGETAEVEKPSVKTKTAKAPSKITVKKTKKADAPKEALDKPAKTASKPEAANVNIAETTEKVAVKTVTPVEVVDSPVVVEKTMQPTPAAEPVAVSNEPEVVAADADALKFKRPARINRPEMPDDLKVISGVGPKLEKVLNDLGIWSYDQIAGWTPQEIAWIDDFLQFSGRIERDAWLSQAADLANGDGPKAS